MPKRGGKFVIAIYCRTSTDRQHTRSQLSAVKKWISAQKYPDAELVWYQDDGVSGATSDRAALNQLMLDVKAGKIQRLVMFELSRLSRSFLDLLKLMETLTKHKVIVETPTDGEIKFDDTMQKFLVAAKALTADHERERIRDRTRSGLASARERGVRLGAPAGNKNRRGKLKAHSAEFLQRLERLSRKFNIREVAGELKVSAATVSRLQRRHGFGKQKLSVESKHANLPAGA